MTDTPDDHSDEMLPAENWWRKIKSETPWKVFHKEDGPPDGRFSVKLPEDAKLPEEGTVHMRLSPSPKGDRPRCLDR